jgi:methylthioribose-1-phosphate isomerase
MQDGIAVTLIADSAAGWLMQQGLVQWVVAGADRIAANGDTANKIGTYALATLARAHGVKFMIAAPLSTIDRATASGADIPIEHRGPDELTHLAGQPIAAPGVAVLNPVFDVTPAHLIDALATERGLIERPDRAAIEALFRS